MRRFYLPPNMAFQKNTAPDPVAKRFLLHPVINVLYSRANWVATWLSANRKSRECSLLLVFMPVLVPKNFYHFQFELRLGLNFKKAFFLGRTLKKEID